MSRCAGTGWLVLVASACASVATVGAQAPTSAPAALERGVVIERVACADKPGQSYALYLPTRYSPDKRWPILYAFDPGARGAMPVRLAKDAAERFGWIVVASNNSRNGPWQETSVAIDALLRDTEARLATDPKRIYTAGLSGGARVATNLAMACHGCVAGVFAQAAGLPIGVSLTKERAGFAWFGSAGETDFNYPELLQLDKDLRALGLRARLRVFKGGHQWAPAEVWMEAFEWLELAAINDARRPRDEALVGELAAAASARAAELERASDLLGLARELRALGAAFAGRVEAQQADARLKTLVASREYRDAERRERGAIDDQNRATTDFAREAQALHDGDAERFEALLRAKRAAAQLKGDAAREKEPLRKQALERALGGAFVQMMEEGQAQLREKHSDAALAQFDVAAALRPEASWPQVQRARAYAQAGKQDDAVKALRRAFELGLEAADFERALAQNAELQPLRDDPALRAALAATPSR